MFFNLPSDVAASYIIAAIVLAIGLIAFFLRGSWSKAQGVDKLILLGPLFYALPIAAFGAEHFTQTKGISSIIPAWLPWHIFWTYFVGLCLIAAALSLVTGIQTRLAAGLLALMFFLFVLLMDAPGWVHAPQNRIALTLMLRELSFSGGPLALAAALSAQQNPRAARIFATIARYFIAIPVLVYCVQQFMHPDHVPGIPLEAMMPSYVPGHAIWTLLTAAVYAIAGPFLLIGKKSRAAATALGLTVLFTVLVVYIPKAVAEHTNLEGLNYLFDTLMYAGTLLMLASAMPRSSSSSPSA